MKTNCSRLAVALTVLLVVGSFGLADAATITYQGRLVDTNGDPVIGAQIVTFNIYSDADGVSSVWTETVEITLDDNGVFTEELGHINSINADLFDGSDRFLGMQVGSDVEMRPLQLLTPATYALNAGGVVDGAITESKIADGSVTANKLAPDAVNSVTIANGTITLEDISANGAADGQIMKWNGTGWIVADDNAGDNPGDITAVTTAPGSGLVGGAGFGDVALSIAPGGITSGMLADSAVTQHMEGFGSGGPGMLQLSDFGGGINAWVFDKVGGNMIYDRAIGLNHLASPSEAGDGQVFNWFVPVPGEPGMWKTSKIDGSMIADGSVGSVDLDRMGASSGQVLKYSGTAWVPADDNQNTGDITGVNAGTGLTGGGTSGAPTLNVGAGSGITLTADAVALDTTYTDGRYVNEGQANSVTSTMIVNGALTRDDLGTGSVEAAEIATGAVRSAEIYDGSIVNADISASAKIAASKVSGLPGVDWKESGGGGKMSTSSASSAIDSVEVVCPSSGYIIATVSGFLYWNVSNTGSGAIRLKVSNIRHDVQEGNGLQLLRRDFNPMPTAAPMIPFSLTRVEPVSAGSNWIYFNAWHQGVNGIATMDDYNLVALFVPVRY